MIHQSRCMVEEFENRIKWWTTLKINKINAPCTVIPLSNLWVMYSKLPFQQCISFHIAFLHIYISHSLFELLMNILISPLRSHKCTSRSMFASKNTDRNERGEGKLNKIWRKLSVLTEYSNFLLYSNRAPYHQGSLCREKQ